MTEGRPSFFRRHRATLLDMLLVFFGAAILVRPLDHAKYLQVWSSIESTFVGDSRFLAANWPHPLWQPLWYCGTRFDYIYPPVLRYGTALLTNIYIPVKAYHVFAAFLFCLGIAGVYFLVRVMGGTRPQSWFSAVASALVSPSFLFMSNMRLDAPYLMPVRLGAMVRYGEGPHISSLSLLPFALAFAYLGLQGGRRRSLILAGIFSALVTLTNFYGATALAILYPVLVWTLWVTHRDSSLWQRALAIPALAYALSAFWLTPSYFRITLYNMRYVSQPGNALSWVLAIIAVITFAVLSRRLASGKPGVAYRVFIAGSLLLMGLNVLGHYYFNFRVLGEPGRLIPEFDMLFLLAAIEAMRYFWTGPVGSSANLRAVRALIVLIALVTAWTTRNFIRHAWDMYPKEPDYTRRVEYRMSDWMAKHMPDARTFVTGSVRFWWDAWRNNAEVGGGSDQGLMNPNPSVAAWETVVGTDPDLTTRWLQSLGADALIVSDATSQDTYRDFKNPGKFVGALPVLYDDRQGNVIYQIPRRYNSLARVVDTAVSKALKPVPGGPYPGPLLAYSDMIERGPASPTATHWNGADSIPVRASPQTGQSVLVQVTYDPAWHAWSGATELPIRQDSMDFMAIDAPPGTHDITLVFQTPFENQLGDALSLLALLLCIPQGFID